MANTFELIASSTVGSGGASSIDFTSIPSTYTDLLVKVSFRGVSSATAILVSRYNADGGNNYVNRFLYGNGSSAGSGNYNPNNSNYYGNGDLYTYTANTFANCEIYQPNYTASVYKSSSADNVSENNATLANVHLSANIWNNTAAITRITLEVYADTFAQYSTAYLYGVKNA
jgi:hypothetical protein